MGGWEAAKQGDCGISALVISDSETGRYHLYDKHTLDDAVDHLNNADLLVGWNTYDFDSRVVFGVTGRYITVPQYDMLMEVWNELGTRKKGYKLDEVAKATIGHGKSGSGEFATTLVRKKRWGQLFNYCLTDVFLVQRLFNHVLDTGWLKGADGQEAHLNEPVTGKEYA